MGKNPETVVLLEDIRSVYNVGSVFRTADASGVDRLLLCGHTAHPPHPRLEKTALDSTHSVAWEYHQEPSIILNKLREKGFTLVAMENLPKAVNLYELPFFSKICFVFGNEVNGVSPQTLQLVDHTCVIPMRGSKTSLNVSVSVGVTLYERLRTTTYNLL